MLKILTRLSWNFTKKVQKLLNLGTRLWCSVFEIQKSFCSSKMKMRIRSMFFRRQNRYLENKFTFFSPKKAHHTSFMSVNKV
jgi:hypothetical protein